MDITLEEDDDIDLTAILRGDVNASYNAGENNRPDPSPAPTPNYAPLPINNDDSRVSEIFIDRKKSNVITILSGKINTCHKIGLDLVRMLEV